MQTFRLPNSEEREQGHTLATAKHTQFCLIRLLKLFSTALKSQTFKINNLSLVREHDHALAFPLIFNNAHSQLQDVQ